VSNYLSQSMLPVSEVENEGFVNLTRVAAPWYSMPTSKTCRVGDCCNMLCFD